MSEAALVIAALMADALLGDPPSWPHLVRVMGWGVSRLESWARRGFSTPFGLRLAGGLITLAVVGGSGLAAWGLLALGWWLWPPVGWLVGFTLSFQCIAAGQLWREARAVLRPLERGELEEARARLALIVGRETASLDAAGVRRAVIETVAENFSDGVVAPLVYLAWLGPAGAVAYKAVNTLDSMLGYRQEPYRDLGLVPARVDDVVNWLPARVSGWLLVAAAALAGGDARRAARVLWRDHGAHASPNAGWPEAAMAGALGVRLGGPNRYHGRWVDKPWLNPSAPDPASGDAAAALRLLVVGTVLAGGLAVLGAWWG